MRRVNSTATINSSFSSTHSTDDNQHTMSRSLPTTNATLQMSSTSTSAQTNKATTKAAKVARRMLKKASAARASRRRKKAYAQLLNERVQKLQAKLYALQTGDASVMDEGEAAEIEYMDEQAKLIFKLQQCVSNEQNSGEPDAGGDDNAAVSSVTDTEQLKSILHEYVALIYSRINQIDTILYDVEPKLIPHTTLKFVLWMLSQTDDFFDTRNASSQWYQMSKKFGLTATQLNELIQLRGQVADLIRSIQQCRAQLLRVHQHLHTHVTARRESVQELQEVLTVEQMAEFVLYADSQLVTYPDITQSTDTNG